MESIWALGCILERSLTLRITSDPKRRREVAIFCAGMGSAFLLAILLIPLSRLDWKGLMVLGGLGTGWFILAFLTGLCRTEIEFDLARGQIVRRRFCLGKVGATSVLPISQLQAIRVVETVRGADVDSAIAGELQLIRADGKVWATWTFPTVQLAQETRREILDWLREHSVFAAPET